MKKILDGMLVTMSQFLEDPGHQNIFKIAQVQTNSSTTEIKKSSFQEVLDSFLDISAQLENLEMPNSAARAIQAAEIFSTEFYKLSSNSNKKE